jgi:uncharacterized membrane protein YedE/YeeE
MTTRTPVRPSRTYRPAGSLVGATSLVLGPLLGAVGTLFRHEVWESTYPDYDLVEKFHDQNILATQLMTLGFPILILSVFAIAQVADGSRKIAGAAVATSVFGLTALFGKAIQNGSVLAMAGIQDHATLDTLARNILDQSPLVLWTFPLYIVGSLLLGLALWRTETVPRWSAVMVGIGALAPLSVITGIGVLGLMIAAIRIVGSIPLITILLAPRTVIDPDPGPAQP